eukprot:CAMPEP_0168520392 /NCGR_PEP_ID=MMETSP0405-20121227/7946_1 /TAXON_ID=498012 /ORGANISM="Trichosphaerium sp, Strain Am-I-7 wt" /LENGTH=225 /DNA_ID=CAMNT_0008541237 /DNA_START=25 /DNA_END=702 /DNA_ORIENTATION=+
MTDDTRDLPMSLGLKVPEELLRNAVDTIFKSKERKFLESVDIQIRLKNYDASRARRFNGSYVLPHTARPNLRVCIITDAKDLETAKANDLPCITMDELKKFNKQKKPIKKWAKKYDAFLASASLIRMIPRVLGPLLNKMGKFPTPLGKDDDMVKKVADLKATVKFQLKKEMGLGAAVGNREMTTDQIIQNTVLTVNFLLGLLAKGWQNIRSVNLKSTMSAPQRIY